MIHLDWLFSTKVTFLSRLPSVERVAGVELVTVLRNAAHADDWEFVKELIASSLERKYVVDLDHLYSLIPGQQETKTVYLKGTKGE